MPGIENTVAERAENQQDAVVSLPADVRGWTLNASAPPLFIEPQTDSVRTLDGFIAWAAENFDAIEALLTLHGGLVFRGFDVESAGDFSRFVKLFTGFKTGYVGGANVRRELADDVYEASQYAAPLKLPLHQEMAYAISLSLIGSRSDCVGIKMPSVLSKVLTHLVAKKLHQKSFGNYNHLPRFFITKHLEVISVEWFRSAFF